MCLKGAPLQSWHENCIIDKPATFLVQNRFSLFSSRKNLEEVFLFRASRHPDAAFYASFRAGQEKETLFFLLSSGSQVSGRSSTTRRETFVANRLRLVVKRDTAGVATRAFRVHQPGSRADLAAALCCAPRLTPPGPKVLSRHILSDAIGRDFDSKS